MKMALQKNKEIQPNLPPPNWSPTGNEGWWTRDDPSEKWKWVDDVYGDVSAAEWQKAHGTASRPKKKPWWKRVFNKN